MASLWGVAGPALGLAVCAALALGLRGALPEAAGLYPDLLPANPYFVPEHFLLLYIAVPLAVLSFGVLLLAPGALLVLAWGSPRGVGDLAVRGFGASFAVLLGVETLYKLTVGPVSGDRFAALLGAAILAGLIGLALRRARGGPLPDLLASGRERRRLAWGLAIPYACIVVLLPLILWQDMIDDGFEALEIGHSLATHVAPRFPDRGGLMGLGIGMVSMAYPVHWFTMPFGRIEAAARLPLALYLPLLFFALVDLIEWGRPRRLRALEEAALVLCLAIFVVALGYSASYDPYSADLSAPAAFETLTVLCMVAAAGALWSGRPLAVAGFGLLGYFARPSGLLFLGLLGAARWLCEPSARRATLLAVGGALAACVVAFFLYEEVYLSAVSGGAPLGYPSSSIRDRLRHLQLFDFGRILWILLPTGALPIFALAWFRAQDPLARALTLVSVVYFGFFYVQAFVALHHFVPGMILPLVVFWRLALGAPERRWLPLAALGAGGLCLWLSLPRHFEVYRGVRELGRVIDYRIGDYDGPYASYRTALDHRELFYELFPADWALEDPSRERAGASLGLLFYATRLGGPEGGPNYVIQPLDAPEPAGFTKVAEGEGGSVWVRDLARWQRDRARVPRTDYRSPPYEIPRETLFRHVGGPAGNYTVDLKAIPGVRRLF